MSQLIQALPKPTPEQFITAISQIERFSPAPAILANALTLIRHPQTDIDSIAELVAQDSALTAEVIRCANSAYFGRSGTCSTIGDAVQLIGMKQTISLLNLAVSRIVSGRDLDCYGIHGADFWAESLYNGLFLQALAVETGEGDPDEAYTAGLLRYIGRLAINQAVTNLHCGLFWVGGESISEWERDNVGLLQAQAGAILLRNWRFSDRLVEAIACQDAPAAQAAGSELGEALYFSAAILPQGIGTPFLPALDGSSWRNPTLGTEYMHRHDLNAASVEALLVATNAKFEEIRESFGA